MTCCSIILYYNNNVETGVCLFRQSFFVVRQRNLLDQSRGAMTRTCRPPSSPFTAPSQIFSFPTGERVCHCGLWRGLRVSGVLVKAAEVVFCWALVSRSHLRCFHSCLLLWRFVYFLTVYTTILILDPFGADCLLQNIRFDRCRANMSHPGYPPNLVSYLYFAIYPLLMILKCLLRSLAYITNNTNYRTT